MILFLASEQNTNLLDFDRLRIGDNVQVPVKKMVGQFVLKQFVIHDMRNFSHIREIVLDRRAFDDSDEDFAAAIQQFLTMYKTRVTVVWEGLTAVNKIFPVLINSGVGNLVCSQEIRLIQQEIIECLSEKGMVQYIRCWKQSWYYSPT